MSPDIGLDPAQEVGHLLQRVREIFRTCRPNDSSNNLKLLLQIKNVLTPVQIAKLRAQKKDRCRDDRPGPPGGPGHGPGGPPPPPDDGPLGMP